MSGKTKHPNAFFHLGKRHALKGGRRGTNKTHETFLTDVRKHFDRREKKIKRSQTFSAAFSSNVGIGKKVSRIEGL